MFVQLVAVCDDQHPRILDVLSNPFGDPDHDETFSTALCVPDDAPFSSSKTFLCSLDGEVLVMPADLLYAHVKYDEIMNYLQESFLSANRVKMFVERISDIVAFLPSQVILLWSENNPVAESFGVVSRHYGLIRGKEIAADLIS